MQEAPGLKSCRGRVAVDPDGRARNTFQKQHEKFSRHFSLKEKGALFPWQPLELPEWENPKILHCVTALKLCDFCERSSRTVFLLSGTSLFCYEDEELREDELLDALSVNMSLELV